MKAYAFSPAHITGFFEIHDEGSNPLLIGSRGAGICIGLGVLTKVEVFKNHKNEVFVKKNSSPVNFKVTRRTVEELLKFSDGNYRVVVVHKFRVPIGSGFGSSGAGALSTALALNEALKLNLTKVEAARAAHIAEVEYRTGLGDVAGQLVGGLEVRKGAGAPGIGFVERVSSDKLSVVCASLGVYETSNMITDPCSKERINKVGGWALSSFLPSPSLCSFIKLSSLFAEKVGFMNFNLLKLMRASIEAGALGLSVKKRVVFALVKEEDVEEVFKVFRAYLPKEDCFISYIEPRGARVL